MKYPVSQETATQFNYGSAPDCVCDLVMRVPDGAGDVPARRAGAAIAVQLGPFAAAIWLFRDWLTKKTPASETQTMARRKRNRELDIAQGVAQLIALIVLGAIFVPPIRQMLLGLVVFVVGAVALAVVVGLGVVLIRRSERKPLFDATPLTTFNTTLPPPATLPERKPQTSADLVQQLRSIDWFQFEQLVALVYRKQGYSVSRRGGANPDGGIDLVIEKNGTRTAIQCKHWKTWNVGVKAVREFLGALTDSGIQRGLFITLGGCTGDAKQLADKHGIEVVDETGLARMLEATDARFDPDAMEILHDTRKLCPKCKREMLLRTASKGRGAGQKFWGCPAYPRCRFTMPPSNSEPRAELTAVR